MTSIITSRVKSQFGDRLQQNAPLSRYTTARIGGPADGLIEIHSVPELVEASAFLTAQGIPCKAIGGGSNLLIGDNGYRGIILINRTSDFRFERNGSEFVLFCDSGVNFGSLARKGALEGFSGLEWAAGIPGSLGGAAYGNAGAHGSDLNAMLVDAELLLADGSTVRWQTTDFGYGYRTSRLKRHEADGFILRATLKGAYAPLDEIRARMNEFTARRRASQPTGASMGSIFKNPANDHAGRLIEAAGLKGKRIGGVEISTRHANFFINDASGTASDYLALIRLAQKTVMDQFGVHLETEIELLGDFKDGDTHGS